MRLAGEYNGARDALDVLDALLDFAERIVAVRHPLRTQISGVDKYGGETRPDFWIANFYATYQHAGRDEESTVQYLPTWLDGPTRLWLGTLPPRSIDCWSDPERAFTDRFSCPFNRPEARWEYEFYIQKPFTTTSGVS